MNTNQNSSVQANNNVSDQTLRTELDTTEPSKNAAFPTFSNDNADQENVGYLDNIEAGKSDGFTVSGWNATNQAYNKPYHYIIAYDVTQNKELQRTQVFDDSSYASYGGQSNVKRDDVAAAYPNIKNAGLSGFKADFAMAPEFGVDTIQFISRWTDDPEGNGHAVDLWFDPVKKINRGSLDSATVKDGKLIVTGWHANDVSVFQQFDTLILLQDGQEIMRTEDFEHFLQRDDVAKAFPDSMTAANSGFSAEFDASQLQNGHQYTLIHRYFLNPNDANTMYTDMSFNLGTYNNGSFTNTPVAPQPAVDEGNYASLDNITSADGKVTVSGWHASNRATDMKYHYIIAYDQTHNREIARQKVDEDVMSRPDVAEAYANVKNAGNSGFKVNFNLTPAFAQGATQFISRWTNDSEGNGANTVDYYFAPVDTETNEGYLDSFNLSNGKLSVAGWHANDASLFKPYHYLIVFDNTTNSQVGQALVSTQDSPDVAKAYNNLRTAGHSRFNYTFDDLKLTAGHSYSIVSRYSDSNTGNGGAGDYKDYWYPVKTLNESNYSIDSHSSVKSDKGNYTDLTGWFANDGEIANYPYTYVILLDDKGELGRTKVTQTSRPDVANAFPGLYNSANSGFSAHITYPRNVSGNLRVVFRYTNDPEGNGENTVDIYDSPIDPNYQNK